MTDLSLIERLQRHVGLCVSHPHFSPIVNDCLEAASALASQQERIAEQAATIAELRKALKEFSDHAGHKLGCDLIGYIEPVGEECNCGFDAALAKVEGET
jgi:hypothetical protein